MILHAQFIWAVFTGHRSHYISRRPYVHISSGTQELSSSMAVWGSFPGSQSGRCLHISPSLPATTKG